MDSSTRRKHCFIEEEEEEDDGGQAASLTDMEAGVSGNHHPFFNRTTSFLRYRTVSYRSSTSSSSLRNLSLSNVSSPRSARFYDGRFEEHQPHFLESCSLCKKPLGDNRDIFMYRGDTPFCSEECREEQMDIDEAKEKNWNLSSSMKALRKKDQNKSTSPTKTRNYPFRTGTVAAA